MSHYNLELLPADFIKYIKALQSYSGHEMNAYCLARFFDMRIRVGEYNYAIPEAEPRPTIVVQPWYYGWSNDTIRHEIGHVFLYWSGLEDQILYHYGTETGWEIVEHLCRQAEAFLQIPQPLVDAAVRKYGVTAGAVMHLSRTSGARTEVALRRIVYDDPANERAGFIIRGRHVVATETCNLSLPFSWMEYVPRPRQRFPRWAKVTITPVRESTHLVGVAWM